MDRKEERRVKREIRNERRLRRAGVNAVRTETQEYQEDVSMLEDGSVASIEKDVMGLSVGEGEEIIEEEIIRNEPVTPDNTSKKCWADYSPSGQGTPEGTKYKFVEDDEVDYGGDSDVEDL